MQILEFRKLLSEILKSVGNQTHENYPSTFANDMQERRYKIGLGSLRVSIILES